MSQTQGRIQEIADKVAENKILTSVARVAITACLVIGAPAGIWMVSSTSTHAIAIAEIKVDARSITERVGRLEAADAQILGRVDRGLNRLQEVDRLLGQIEERTNRMLDSIERRRTDLMPQDSTTQ